MENVKDAYMQAYKLKTKGITIYRDGCRSRQVLYKGDVPEKRLPQDRPNSLPSVTDKIKTGFGNLYVTISYLDQKPFEVFTSIPRYPERTGGGITLVVYSHAHVNSTILHWRRRFQAEAATSTSARLHASLLTALEGRGPCPLCGVCRNFEELPANLLARQDRQESAHSLAQ